MTIIFSRFNAQKLINYKLLNSLCSSGKQTLLNFQTETEIHARYQLVTKYGVL